MRWVTKTRFRDGLTTIPEEGEIIYNYSTARLVSVMQFKMDVPFVELSKSFTATSRKGSILVEDLHKEKGDDVSSTADTHVEHSSNTKEEKRIL
jgi:hypothetical protein